MKKQKEPDGMFIELDGRVNILTREKGKEVREELDGKVVLESLLLLVTSALESAIANHPSKLEKRAMKKRR